MKKQKLLKVQFHHFHKWINKGYGIFSSIHRMVIIGVIPLSYNLLALPISTFGQPDTVSISKNVDIDEVIVNSERKASTYSELTRVVKVVSCDELSLYSSISLPEILERLAMVDVRQRGGQGVQSDINFRGGTFDQTLVLLNGVNISDPQTGHHSLDIPIDIDAIQRIEILQGPGAREFGQGAFAGAINIITDTKSQNKLGLSVFSGQYGLVKSTLDAFLGNQNFRTMAQTSFNRSDGYIKNTDFRNKNIFIHSTLKSILGSFSIFGGYQDKGFGANSFYTPKYPDQYEATSTIIGALQYRKNINRLNFGLDGYYRKHLDRFELFRNNPESWYLGHNYHRTDVYGIKSIFQALSSLGKSEFGLELRREEILSNKLGDSLSIPVPVAGEKNIYYTKGDSRDIMNVFLSHTIYLNKAIISGGSQYSYSDKFGGILCWGADFSYLFNSSLRFFTSVNRTFRLPTFTDLFYEGPTNIGNPNLNPEFAITYEAGLKYANQRITAHVAGFYRDGKDLIDWVKLPTETQWHTINYTNVNTHGIDFSLQCILKDKLSLINYWGISYSYLNSDKKSGDFDSYYILDYLKHNLSIYFNLEVFKHISLDVNCRYQDRAGVYNDFKSGQNKEYPSFWIFDTRLNYSGDRFDFYVNASNLFNVHYVDIANVLQPGLWVGAGVNIRVDL